MSFLSGKYYALSNYSLQTGTVEKTSLKKKIFFFPLLWISL
jgi:hypothetical protein